MPDKNVIMSIDKAITDCLRSLGINAEYVFVMQAEGHAVIGTNMLPSDGPARMMAAALHVMKTVSPDIDLCLGDSIGEPEGHA